MNKYLLISQHINYKLINKQKVVIYPTWRTLPCVFANYVSEIAVHRYVISVKVSIIFLLCGGFLATKPLVSKTWTVPENNFVSENRYKIKSEIYGAGAL